MKRVFGPAALLVVVAFAGCGGPDRASLAKSTVQTYWSDIDHAKFKEAYGMLTSGNRATISLVTFERDFIGSIENSSGISVRVGAPSVNGDNASVPVGLISPRAPNQVFHAYQHLYWQNGGWKISDPNGGLSKTK